jgi:undecaprenyl diphosphate synthase
MWTGSLPEPDLIIRTSGAMRLSNFLLFQAAYSELKFLNCHWPEITEEILQKSVNDFYERKRNYGV